MKLKTLNQMILQNENLLNFVAIPSDIPDLNETALKQAIVRRCGEVEPYYQRDTDFMLFGTLWFNTHHFLFSHAVALWNATYNPIENYDRTETETIETSRTGERDNTDTHSGTDATTTSGTRSNTDTHSGTDTTTRNLTDNTITNRETGIAGFNSEGFSDSNNEDETSTITKTGTEALQHGETITTNESTNGTESLAHGHRIASSGTESEESDVTRNSRIHGNIGVTTAQQMIEAEIELARRFWVYDYIASAFESDNFITVYKSYYDEGQFNDIQ